MHNFGMHVLILKQPNPRGFKFILRIKGYEY